MLVKYTKNKRVCLYDDENPPLHIPPPETPKTPFKSCGSCNYHSHGFFCFKEEGICMKTDIQNLNERKRKNEINSKN